MESVSTLVRAFLTRRLDPLLMVSYLALAVVMLFLVGGAGLYVARVLGGG